MASTAIDDLFAGTLKQDYDDDGPWEAVQALRRLGTRDVFERAAAWCKSDDPLMRGRGLDVLAQLGKTADHPVHSFPEDAYGVISELLQREKDLRPIESAIYALGHLDNIAAVPLIAAFHGHASADIRFSVACSLGSFPNDDLSVETLLLLMEDSDEDVRDWATFGLGVQGDQDSPKIREALYCRLSDPNEDVREEAMVGLGKRKDQRVLPLLFAAVNGPEIKIRVAEAASLMLGMEADPEGWGPEEYRIARDRTLSLLNRTTFAQLVGVNTPFRQVRGSECNRLWVLKNS
jgi:HEAT repeat protein